LIRAHLLTGAKTYESEVADALVLGDERAVYADKAYEKRARRESLKARGIKDRIQHRRTRAQKQLPRWQVVRNKLIGRIRQAVERTFSQLKGRYGLTRMRYAGIAANAFHLTLIAMAYNLRTAAQRTA
jgi:IS5 family transposase